MPRTSNRSARELIPEGGKSGTSFPGGTGIASVVPAVFPAVSVATYNVFPSKDHWTGQPYVQIVQTSLPVVEKALTRPIPSLVAVPAVTHSPWGEVSNLLAMGISVIRARPVPSSLIRTR